MEHVDAATSVVEDELRSIQTFAAFKPSYRFLIYVGANFSAPTYTSASLLSEIVSRSTAFAALAKTPTLQRQLIAAFEWFCASKAPTLIKFFPVILKHLFDEEILEEDSLLEWSTDPARNEYSINSVSDESLDQLRALAVPFIVWLQEAEEEGDEDDEDDA